MKALLLTLGHNASAIGIHDHRIVCGYEEERLSGIKSDSHYPALAIERVSLLLGNDIDEIHITHWFLDGELPKVPNKYFNGDDLYHRFPNAKIYTLSRDFTHHDSHAWSGLLFAQNLLPQDESTFILVADGFGNFSETVSLYRLTNNEPRLIDRSFGFNTSLGLFYQYATAFLELKENQDEYKLLGYEAHIEEIEGHREWIKELNERATKQAKKLYQEITTYELQPRFDPFCSVDALPALRLYYKGHFEHVLRSLGFQRPHDLDMFTKRVIIAYYTQSVVEQAITLLLADIPVKNLIVAGGLFMNVKINNLISSLISGKLSVMPLAGDQGCALGLYKSVHPEFSWPNHLFWGKRSLDFAVLHVAKEVRLEIITDEDELTRRLISLIIQNKIVNLVRGSMEFGARALCNTSTLALPLQENVEYINRLNGRSSIMPMAPVVTRKSLEKHFTFPDQIAGSLEYMICTRNYIVDMHKGIDGASHKVPFTKVYTGRPQVTYDGVMTKLLKDFEILINTSFNEHGKPICFEVSDILRCHNYQLLHDNEERVHTLIYPK